MEMAAIAVVGHHLCSRLADVTDDLGALESKGFWAVAIDFHGKAVCARFDSVRPARPWRGRPWKGLPADSWTSSLDQAGFTSGVSEIRDMIAAGNVYQVNLTRRLSAPLIDPDTDIAALGAALAEGNPAPYAAVLRLPDYGVHIASASPERFLERNGQWVKSSPIKGTAAEPSGLTPKDQAENLMIVDLVRNDLGRVCDYGTVTVDDLMVVERYSHVMHLVSGVSGRLRDGLGPVDVVRAVFPHGTVSGAPKVRAMEIIDEMEPVARGPYAGAAGYMDFSGNVDTAICLRTVVVADGTAWVQVGAGLVADSDPAAEFQETEDKAAAALAAVAGAELL